MSLLTRSDTLKEADDKLYLERLMVSAQQKRIPPPIRIPRPDSRLVNSVSVYISPQPISPNALPLNLPPVETVPYIHPCAESPQDHQQIYPQAFTNSIYQQPIYHEQSNFNTGFNQSHRQGTLPFNTDLNRGFGTISVISPIEATVEVVHNPFRSKVINTEVPSGINLDTVRISQNTNVAASSSHDANHVADIRNSTQQSPAMSGYQNGSNVEQIPAKGVRRVVPVVTFPSLKPSDTKVQIYSVINELPQNIRSPQMVGNIDRHVQQPLILDPREEEQLEQSYWLLPTHHTPQHELEYTDKSKKQQRKKPNVNKSGNKVNNMSQTGQATSSEYVKCEALDKDTKRMENKKSGQYYRTSYETLLENTQNLHQRIPKTIWLDRLSGIFPIGFMSTFGWLFMLSYNVILSIFVYQASRFPNETNTPVFVLAIIFFISAGVSISGMISTYFLQRSRSSKSGTSNVPFRVFQALYIGAFTMSTITMVGMESWLILNTKQTNFWDLMYLKTSASSTAPVLSFESILKQHEMNPDYWIIDVRIWIPVYIFIWILQMYFCLCYVSFGRKVRRHNKIQKRRRLLMSIDMEEPKKI